jgi:hypothetical protein
MDKALGMHSTTFENVILLASRLLLAWIFVHEEFFSDEIFAKGRVRQRSTFPVMGRSKLSVGYDPTARPRSSLPQSYTQARIT